jgi:hypothetical protein
MAPLRSPLHLSGIQLRLEIAQLTNKVLDTHGRALPFTSLAAQHQLLLDQ